MFYCIIYLIFSSDYSRDRCKQYSHRNKHTTRTDRSSAFFMCVYKKNPNLLFMNNNAKTHHRSASNAQIHDENKIGTFLHTYMT